MAPRRNAEESAPQESTTPETTTEDSTTKEVEEILATAVENLRPSQRAVLQLLHWMESMATEDTDSGAVFGDDIAAILMAEDEATMWDADELPRLNAKVLSGCELDLYGFQVKFSNSSDIISGFIAPQTRRKMYLLIRAARLNDAQADPLYRLPDPGEEFQWNTSARFIVAKMYWLQSRGRFDNGATVKARIQGTKLDEAGRSVEKLKELSAPVVQGRPEEIPF